MARSGAFPMWERGVEPNGFIRPPQEGNTAGEVLGAGLQNLGQAGAQVGVNLQRANDALAEQAWQTEQPKLAQALAQANADSSAALADIKAKSPADLTGYPEQVG